MEEQLVKTSGQIISTEPHHVPTTTTSDSVVIIGDDIKQSIYKLYCISPVDSNSKSKNDNKKCGICLKYFRAGSIVTKTIDHCLLNSEVISVVLQCLLVPPPQSILCDDNKDDNLSSSHNRNNLVVCKKCDEEASALVDVFLRLEDLRKEFETLRKIFAHKVITKSIGKSRDEFLVWEEEAEATRHTYPSMVDLKVNGHGGYLVSSKDDPNSNHGKNKLVERPNTKITQGNSIPSKLSQATKEDSKVLERASGLSSGGNHDDHAVDSLGIGDGQMEVDTVDSYVAGDKNFHGSSDGRGSPTSESIADVPFSEKRKLGYSSVQVKLEDSSFDIIMDKNVTFMTADKKLTRMSPVVVLDKIQAPNKKIHEIEQEPPPPFEFAFRDNSIQIDVKVEVQESDNLNYDEHSSEISYANIHPGHNNDMESFQSSTSVKCEEVNSVKPNDVEVPEDSPVIGRRSLRSRTIGNENKIICSDDSSQEETEDEEYNNNNGVSSFESDESDGESEVISDEDNEEDDLEQVEEDKKTCLYRNGKNYLCTLCGKNYQKTYNLKRHIKVVHKTDPDNVLASESSTPLVTEDGNISLEESLAKRPFQLKPGSLKRNRKKQVKPPSKIKPKKKRTWRTKNAFPCQVCPLAFTDRSVLLRHLKTIHKRKGELPQSMEVQSSTIVEPEVFYGPKLQFQCWKCVNSYALKGSLRVHLMQDHAMYEKLCFYCFETFKTRAELNEHKKYVHGERAPTGWRKDEPNCTLCGVNFNQRRSSFRVQHMYRKHGIFVEEPTLKCSHCDLVFNDSEFCKQHKLKFHSVGSKEDGTQCEMCLKFFSSRRNLSHHKTNVHTVNGKLLEIFKCGVCRDAVEYLNGEGLMEHENSEEHQIEVRKRVSVYCNVCRKNFNGDVNALENHLGGDEHKKELENLGQFERNRFCVPCRKEFETFEELVEHEDTGVSHRNVCSEFRMNQIGEEVPLDAPLICHACPKSFDHQSLLDSHIAQCHPPAGHVCKVCSVTFSTSMELALHKRSHTAAKNFVCDKCGKKSASKKSLQVHIRDLHGGEVSCDNCGETFPSKAKLRRHIENKHTKAKPVKNLRRLECSYCEKTYKTVEIVPLRKHLVKQHPKEHLKEKKHFCCVCFHIFGKEEELNIHLETHAHLKCHECNRYYLNTVHFQSHMRIHTGERPFKCSLCDQSFKTNGHLKQHVTGVHKHGKRKAAEDEEDSQS